MIAVAFMYSICGLLKSVYEVIQTGLQHNIHFENNSTKRLETDSFFFSFDTK